MTFSSNRIQGPKQGLLAVHPFVDVLEGRELFCVAFNGIVVPGHAEGADLPPANAAAAPAELAAPAYGVDGATFFSNGAQVVAPARPAPANDYLPAVIQGKAREAKAGPFSARSIEDDAAALFNNVFHDRRGRSEAATLHLEVSTGTDRRAEDDDVVDAASPFRDGRSLGGTMRPIVTMSMVEEEYPFAA